MDLFLCSSIDVEKTAAVIAILVAIATPAWQHWMDQKKRDKADLELQAAHALRCKVLAAEIAAMIGDWLKRRDKSALPDEVMAAGEFETLAFNDACQRLADLERTVTTEHSVHIILRARECLMTTRAIFVSKIGLEFQPELTERHKIEAAISVLNVLVHIAEQHGERAKAKLT